jgi:formate-dependent nitrite reductase cytochrome c552 subunit
MRRSTAAVTGLAAHDRAGVNCSGCHDVADASGKKSWTDHPGYQACQTCHRNEADGFLSGKHGMRLAAALAPMSPGIARLPMNSGARQHTLGCGSCHSAHVFDTRRAAVDACLGCHADDHSLVYKGSRHFELWRAEIEGAGPAGSGISCATCHMPRLAVEGETGKAVRVQHNQNANLRPSEKMIREVCMNCHGLSFSIDALADSRLVEANFRGRPSRHVESMDMAVKKTARQ